MIARRLVALYLREEAHGDLDSALGDLEARYGLRVGALREAADREVASRAALLAETDHGLRIPTAYELQVRTEQGAEVFLAVLPDAEFLTAMEHGRWLASHEIREATADGGTRIRAGGLLDHAAHVFERRGLPYAASMSTGITYIGERAITEERWTQLSRVLAIHG